MNRGALVRFTRVLRTFAAIFALVFLVQTNARAMVIHLIFDSSITSQPNAAQIEAASPWPHDRPNIGEGAVA